jgi:membrane protease YdiL (CAAX protease family)
MRFSYALLIALVGALAAAVIISPLAAFAVAAAGFRFPFPRIFDRTVMATLLAAMILLARPLRFKSLLAAGFRDPGHNWLQVLRGFVVAATVMALLFACAVILGAHGGPDSRRLYRRLPYYLFQAGVVGLIEEGFFRAFLLGGIASDLGRRGALIVSSAIYSVSHLLRSPARIYLVGFHPAAGLHNLQGSAIQLSHPATAVPALIGLFLLGLVLGEAYLLTETVYLSIGLHAGFVVGAKTWPALLTPGVRLPWWIRGYRRFPLISGPAGWAAALIVLTLLPWLCRTPDIRNQLSNP